MKSPPKTIVPGLRGVGGTVLHTEHRELDQNSRKLERYACLVLPTGCVRHAPGRSRVVLLNHRDVISSRRISRSFTFTRAALSGPMRIMIFCPAESASRFGSPYSYSP